jgi:hypothetical protein
MNFDTDRSSYVTYKIIISLIQGTLDTTIDFLFYLQGRIFFIGHLNRICCIYPLVMCMFTTSRGKSRRLGLISNIYRSNNLIGKLISRIMIFLTRNLAHV